MEKCICFQFLFQNQVKQHLVYTFRNIKECFILLLTGVLNLYIWLAGLRGPHCPFRLACEQAPVEG